MKKQQLLVLSITFASLLLGACNKKGSTEEQIDVTPITFENAYYQIDKLSETEAKYASSVSLKTTSQSGSIVDETNETFTQYLDETSSSKGTLTRKINNVETFSTTYKTIKTKTIDKYNMDGQVYEYNMLTTVKDYENDDTPTSSYKDSVSKKFIINSKAEAEQAGLTESQYVLSSEVVNETSANSAGTLNNFLSYCVVSNVYLTQLGLTTMAVEYNPTKEEVHYSLNANYSYDGDLNNTVQESIYVEYVTDKTKSMLLSFDCDYTVTYVSNTDATDQYVSTTAYEGTITYGDQKDEKDSDILNPDNYFLASISEIGLLARNSNFDDVNVDASAIPANCSYIFGYAKTYTPKKAVDIDITPVSSSNTDVVELTSDGKFHILTTGTTTLYFGYYQKIDGVYNYVTKAVPVTITDAKVESITFNAKLNPYYHSSLVAGNTYNWDISVSPSKASNAITASSSDESVLTVSVDENNDIVITTLKEGKATITVTSVATPEINKTKDFYVLSDTTDYSAYIQGHSFLYDAIKIYNYSFTMTFNADGTGTRVQYDASSSQSYTDTFKWTISSNVITFSNWSYTDDGYDFDTATICKFLDKDGEPMGFYAETDALGKAFVEQ